MHLPNNKLLASHLVCHDPGPANAVFSNPHCRESNPLRLGSRARTLAGQITVFCQVTRNVLCEERRFSKAVQNSSHQITLKANRISSRNIFQRLSPHQQSAAEPLLISSASGAQSYRSPQRTSRLRSRLRQRGPGAQFSKPHRERIPE